MSSSPEALHDLRSRVDELDRCVVKLLALRQSTVDAIAEVKEQSDRSVRDPERESELFDRLRRLADAHGVSPDLIEELFDTIVEHSVTRQHSRRGPSPLRKAS